MTADPFSADPHAADPQPRLTGALILSVQVGGVAPLGPDGVSSGFVKRPVDAPVAVRRLGLAGDAQADLRVHGGPDKAVYFYAAEHYPTWRAELPDQLALLTPGGFGENLTTVGVDEDTVCIGDVLGVGSTRLQITQPRQPCFKLGLRFADNSLARAMVRSGRSGWYARVLEDGAVQRGDPIALLDRLNPAWPVSRLGRLIAHRGAAPGDMAALSTLPGLARNWRRIAAAAVEAAAP